MSNILNINKLNPNSQPKEVFNYKEYLEFMESKKVRHAEERTNTLLDFVTEERLHLHKGTKSDTHLKYSLI